jgi:hypothetical protein
MQNSFTFPERLAQGQTIYWIISPFHLEVPNVDFFKLTEVFNPLNF